jgi:hypothetical protein
MLIRKNDNLELGVSNNGELKHDLMSNLHTQKYNKCIEKRKYEKKQKTKQNKKDKKRKKEKKKK